MQLIPAISPGLVPFEDDLDLGLQRTLKQNADYRKSAITLRSRSLLVDQARDRARPEVNLTLRAGLSGIGANYSDDIRGLSDLEGRSWQGGFTLDIPLGAHAERERYHRRLSEFEQEKLNRNYQREKLVQQVKEDFRQVQTDRKRAEVARMAEELAERHVREEEDRLALGVSTVREVLDAQDDLAAARASKIKAIVDFNKSVVKWTHLTGQ